ncbi:mitochondria protoheme IX farnesyltransferase [Xylariomycetidae sp. FL0641]|nr:mitochondria protoheme IX farnesyltransferase [Xylariomycetidae sp. FL0641]
MSLRPAGNVFRLRGLAFALAHDGPRVCCQQAVTYSSTASSVNRHPRASTPKSAKSRLNATFFLSNSALPRLIRSSSVAHTPRHHHDATATRDLPHRRRQAARRLANGASTSNSAFLSSSPKEPTSNPSDSNDAAASVMPPDASSLLTTASTKHPSNSLRRQLSLLLSLSKPRLTVLIVLTAMAPYALYPVPEFLSPSIGLDTPSLSPLTLAFLTTGTFLCSASANALNMLYEPAWDAMMSRTRNRPLVRGLLSQRRALAFAVAAAIAGVGALYFGVNPTVAFLGAANIALYAGVYTPMKRMSCLNTWVGAVVGGIPPLMGWAAAAGEYATGEGSSQELLFTPDAVGGWLLAALLFAWQFPHFMALSWPIREEYKNAGHQMLCWVNPARNARVALRYSLVFVPLSVALCYVGITEWSFAITSLPVNLWLAREAVRFWRHQGFQGSARGLFWASVWHLPVILVLAQAQKKGMWQRVWQSVMGKPDLGDDDDDDEYIWVDEDEEEALAGNARPPVESRR